MVNKTLFISAWISIALIFNGCGDTEQIEDSKDVARERNNAKFSAEEKYDADFMVDIADIVLCEIQASQTAIDKAGADFTKKYAGDMLASQKKLYNDIKTLSSQKSISIPDEISFELKELAANLEKLKPEDYDQQYCSHMIESHKETIIKFERAAKNAYDSHIKQWAEDMLPQLRRELDGAYACEDSYNK